MAVYAEEVRNKETGIGLLGKCVFTMQKSSK